MKQSYDMGAKWTSRNKEHGFRHFRITGRRKTEFEEIELMAVLDRKVRFWLRVEEFKVDKNWALGWE